MRHSATWVLTAVLLLLGGGLQAASGQTAGSVPAGTAEVQQLRTAYMTLYVADHDYHGHRIKAMRAIEKACKLLGTDISGDGKGHEKQSVSDAQLTQAQQIISAVLQGNAVTSQPKVAKHLQRAVNEISLALKVH